MRSADLYTKIALSIIALCLLVLCVEQSPWSRLETVQAQQPFIIQGFSYDNNGIQKTYHLGTNASADEQLGFPVVVVRGH